MSGNRNGRGGFGRYIRIGVLATESWASFRLVSYELFTKGELTDPSKEAPISHRVSELMMGNGWRPFTLRPLALILFLLSTFGLIATIGAFNCISM